MAENASFSFTDIPNVRGVDATLTRGVTPSTFTLYCLPFDGLNVTGGTLSMSYAGNTIQLTDCALATAYIRKRYDGKWPLWSITGADRRWKWKFSTISGDWNRRLADGTLDTNTAKTPGELATLLLQALGETGFDTSRMPSSVKPRALWKTQRADLALQALCDYVACEVVLNWQTNKVEIWPLGVGANIPDGLGEIYPKYRYVPRNIPATIQVQCGDSLYQTKLKLQAVTRDYTTGNRKLIANSEFKPSTGWDKESPFGFPGISDTNNRASAYEQVWREFQISGQQDGSLNVPNCPETIASVNQYVLNDVLLETETDLAGFKRNLPCYVDGDYYAYTDLPNNGSSMRYTGAFALDAERRIVKFPYPLFKLDSSGYFAEPTLYLTTSYKVRSTTGQFVNLTRQGNVGAGTGTLVLRRPELFAIYSSSTAPGAQTNTQSQVQVEADAYIALFSQKFANPNATELTYPGFLPFVCDGNIAQVSWSASLQGSGCPRTQVCEQLECDITAVGLNERRRREQLAQLVEATA